MMMLLRNTLNHSNYFLLVKRKGSTLPYLSTGIFGNSHTVRFLKIYAVLHTVHGVRTFEKSC